MFTIVHIAGLIRSMLSFQLLLQPINYFGFDRLLHSFIHQGVLSFSYSIVITDNAEPLMQR